MKSKDDKITEKPDFITHDYEYEKGCLVHVPFMTGKKTKFFVDQVAGERIKETFRNMPLMHQQEEVEEEKSFDEEWMPKLPTNWMGKRLPPQTDLEVRTNYLWTKMRIGSS